MGVPSSFMHGPLGQGPYVSSIISISNYFLIPCEDIGFTGKSYRTSYRSCKYMKLVDIGCSGLFTMQSYKIKVLTSRGKHA